MARGCDCWSAPPQTALAPPAITYGCSARSHTARSQTGHIQGRHAHRPLNTQPRDQARVPDPSRCAPAGGGPGRRASPRPRWPGRTPRGVTARQQRLVFSTCRCTATAACWRLYSPACRAPLWTGVRRSPPGLLAALPRPCLPADAADGACKGCLVLCRSACRPANTHDCAGLLATTPSAASRSVRH